MFVCAEGMVPSDVQVVGEYYRKPYWQQRNAC
jgi:hypothetical protein